jgi:centrin-1
MRKGNVHTRRRLERPGITEDEIEGIRDAFNWFDTDGTGMIDPKELKAAMLSLNFDTKSPTVYLMVCDMEKRCSGPIDFEEFLNEITLQLGDRESREGIQKIFSLFDDDHTNTISFKNLKRVANEIGSV